MSLKREIPELIEQRDAGNVTHPRPSSTILRKRIMEVLGLALFVLMLTIGAYYQCTYLGSTDWHGFWRYEVVIGVVRVRRERRKLQT
jgi:hypothetical protein